VGQRGSELITFAFLTDSYEDATESFRMGYSGVGESWSELIAFAFLTDIL
jgi:hypothetical protein